MPRLRPKKEIIHVSDMSGTDYTAMFLSYKDRLDDWKNLSEKEQGTIVRELYKIQDSWQCLSSECGKSFSSSGGLVYHLRKCGLPKTPVKRRGRKKQAAGPEDQKPPSTSAGQLESTDEEDEDEEEAEKIDDDDDDFDEKATPSEKRKKAVRLYNSYKDRLDDWRKIPNKEQYSMLGYVIKEKKKLHCLSSSCQIVLSTHGGMQYHLQRCGVPEKDRIVKCAVCGESMAKSAMRDHKFEVHGGPSLKDVKPKLPLNSSVIPDSFELQNQDDTSSAAGDDNQSATWPLAKRGRKPLSLGGISYDDYVRCVAQAYEAFKSETCRDDNAGDAILDSPQIKWKPLEARKTGSYLPYLTESMRFCVEGVHGDGESTSLGRYETLKTDRGFIAFCGGAITAASWCPTETKDDILINQYLLLALNNDSMLTISEDNLCGALQLWRLSREKTEFQLRYVIAHDYGFVSDVKWCPSGQWKPMDSQIGAAAVTSAIGEVGIYILKEQNNDTQSSGQAVRVYKPAPDIHLFAGTKSVVYSLDWSPFKRHNEIVAGLADGSLVLWDLNKRKKPNHLDEKGRLLPLITLDVANAPVRSVKWWSETKVMIAGLDRQMALWDLEENVCISRCMCYQIVNFACLGSFMPAVLYSCDASLATPSVTALDFGSGGKTTMPATHAHSAVVWSIAINPWTGDYLTVDDSGRMCRTNSILLDGILDSKRKRFFEEVVLKSSIMSQNLEDEADVEAYDYAEARRKCWIKFTYTNSTPSKADSEKEFKENGLSGCFPVAALFMACWNQNKKFSNWCCCGGQNGLLHIMNFEVND